MVVQNQHQDHQELVETVVVEQEEMLLMVQLELQTLEVAVEQDLEELVVVDLTLQVQVVQVGVGDAALAAHVVAGRPVDPRVALVEAYAAQLDRGSGWPPGFLTCISILMHSASSARASRLVGMTRSRL